jgi:hypothetical protein
MEPGLGAIALGGAVCNPRLSWLPRSRSTNDIWNICELIQFWNCILGECERHHKVGRLLLHGWHSGICSWPSQALRLHVEVLRAGARPSTRQGVVTLACSFGPFFVKNVKL